MILSNGLTLLLATLLGLAAACSNGGYVAEIARDGETRHFEPENVFELPADSDKKPKIKESMESITFVLRTPANTPESKATPRVLSLIIGGFDGKWLLETPPGALATLAEKRFERTHSNDSVHIFFDPRSASQFADLNRQHIQTHEVSEAELVDAMVGVVDAQKPDRVVIYVLAHGAEGSGSIAYKYVHSATFGSEGFWDAFNKMEALAVRPKHVLLVPFSCFNGNLADGIQAIARTKPQLTMPVSMVHSKDHNESESWDPPGFIMGQNVGLVLDVYEGRLGAKDWLAPGSRLKDLQNLTTLGKWVDFLNLAKHPALSEYTVSHLAPFADEIQLADFEFFPEIHIKTSLDQEKLPYSVDRTARQLVDAIIPAPLRPQVILLSLPVQLRQP